MTNAPTALGNSTLQVGRIGLGCLGMSEFYGGTRDEAGHIKTLHAVIELGINHFDTADMYGVGHNEELVSKSFSDRWGRVTVATKFGVRRGEGGEWLGLCGRPEYVKEACEKSLQSTHPSFDNPYRCTTPSSFPSPPSTLYSNNLTVAPILAERAR